MGGLKKYFHPSRSIKQISNFQLLINIWIILEHSMRINDVGHIRLSQVASLQQFLLWYKFVTWMRIFNATAVYVQLIIDTILNTASFMVMLFIIICTFSSAFLILYQ